MLVQRFLKGAISLFSSAHFLCLLLFSFEAMNPKLNFSEFPPSSMEEWKKLVQKELGEKPYDTLVWTDTNGLTIEPYLVASDNSNAPTAAADIKKNTTGSWLINQAIRCNDLKEANRLILEALQGGANSIAIDADIDSKEDLQLVLKDVLIEYIAVHFRSDKPLQLITWYVELAQQKNLDTRTLRGSVIYQANQGIPENDELVALAKFSSVHFSLFKTVVVEAISLDMQGHNAVQQLTHALNKGNKVLEHLTEHGISIDDASAMLQFAFSIGSSYFVEIAKLKAFRIMWAAVVEQYKPAHACSTNTVVYAETSMSTQTKEDAHTNLLRGTTQAMSAILGGADAVGVTPYDASFAAQNENSLRLARNIQHLLMEESYLSAATHAAEGSYYIEEITKQLIEKNWKTLGE